MIQINPLKSYIDGGVRAAITTPPSASLVFDLPGKAIWVKGVKLKGTDHTYTFSHDNYITLTNTSNSNESEDIKIGVNTSALKNAIDTTYGVVSTTTNGLAPKFTSENKQAASTATTYYFLGWTGSTLKWYQAPFRNVRINSETTDRLGINNTDPLIISSGNGISVTWDSTNKKIIITNTKPDVNHNTHYTTMLYIGENNDTKANKNVANPYLKLFDDSIRRATFQIKAGSGIAVTSDTNGNITITNSSPDVNHNTDRTGIKLTTVSGTKKTDSTLILANSTSGLNIQGGTNKFLIGDGTNYIEVPVVSSVSNKDATIGTALTTIATISGIDIKAKIASYSLSNHTHLVKINGSTKTIAASGAVDLGNYLPLSGGTMGGTAWIVWPDSGNWSNNNSGVTFPVIRGGLQWSGQSDYVKLFTEETSNDNLNLILQFGDDNSNGLSIRDKSNTQTSYISSSGVITTGTFKGNLDWSYITNKPSSYTPSAHAHAWNSLTHSSTTENQAILTNGSANGWKLYTLNISGWNNAANNAHSHSNKSVLDGITSTLVNNWNTAYTFVNTITGTDTDKVINKWDEIVNFLAGITEDNKLNTLLNSKLSVYELADNTNVGAIKNNGIYYSTSDSSSGTLLNSPFSNSFTLINMISYDGGDDLRRSRLAFNAYGEVKVSNDRGQANTAETWYNVLTSNNSGISGSTIKLNGTSITVYSSSTADGRYVKKAGDTMSGVLTIDTTGFGALTIKRNDDTNGASIQFRGKSSVYGYIGLNNSTKDKQFLRWNSDTSKTYTILDTSSTYTSNGKGVINGTTITQVDNADTTDGVHLEWSGQLTYDQYSWLAGWTNDGKKIKAVNKSQFATSGHTHDDRYYTKTESNAKYITDITTSVNKLTFTRNGSNITKDIIVNVVYSQGNLTNISNEDNTTKASSGLFIYNSYSQIIGTNNYSSVLSINTGGTIQIAGNWGDDQTRNLYWRSQSDRAVSSYPWKSWRTILDSENYSSILDSRYYTESEVNNLLSNKLNISNFNWTNLPGKLVAGNEFNIVNAGFNEGMWFNYVPINDRSKTATITGYHFGNGATGYTSIKASGFIKNGSSSSYVLLGDGGHKVISDFATSGHTHSIYSANENYGGFTKSGRLPISGFYQSFESENGGNAPWTSCMHLINCQHSNINNNYALQIAASFYDNNIFKIRVTNGNVNNAWRNIIHSGNIGSQSVASATRLQTARNLWGNSFNGTADISGTIRFNNVTSGLCEGIQWTCGDNDFARIKAGATGSDAGYLEIATADGGNEPIYVRQYSGVFSSVVRTLTLLDANGYTHFPSYINIGGNENNNSSPDRVWGSNSSDSYLRSYRTSALRVSYASSAGNSNTVDGYYQGNAVHYVWTNSYTQPTSGATWYLKIKTTNWKNTSDWIWVSCEGSNAHDEYVINTGSRSNAWWAYGVQYTTQLINGCTKIISNSCDTYIRLTSHCTSVRIYTTFTPASVTNDSASSYTTIVPGLNAPTFYGNATSASNSDTCDGLHVHGGRNNEANKIVRTDGNGYLQVGYINSSNGDEGNNSSPARVWGTNGSDSYMRTYLTSALSVKYATSAGNADTVDGYHATTGRTFNGNINWSENWNDAWSDGTNKHPWYGFDHRYPNTGAYSTTITDFFGMTIKTANTLRLDFGTLLLNGTSIYSINVASATKLQTPRTIWGQSFDGTGNVDNTLRIRQTTGNYCEGIRIQTGDGAWATIILGATADSGTNTNAWSIHRKADNNFAISRNSSDGVNGLVMTSVGMGLGTTTPTHRLDVRGDTKITGSIRDLAIGGGIYWNPYVESTTDSSDVASITVVKSGVAGGTTLVLRQMNDANDTIQFQTSTAAKLYHNSYPILTTQNTYVSNNKGYINGAEITYVNNASSATIATKLASSGYANNALSYYQTDQAFDGSATGWSHYIIANHGDGSSYYHYTIRLPFWSVPQYRRQTGSTSNVTSWYNFITAENISSQSVNYATSAGNSDTVDGLHVHSSRNNEANKIVRTDGNGFIQAGWINTTSGDMGTTAINKIYCSNDDYIRYKTPANFFPTLANSGNNISITVAGQNRTLTVGYATNADKVDGYHANMIYNAPSFTVNNSNTSNTYILLATITISGTSLACAEFTVLFQNRECLDSSSFILSGAIRRSSTTNITATLSYITLHTGTPRNIYLRSDDGVTFKVYIQSVASTWTTYYRAIPIVDSGNITYSNTGTTSPISGSVLNITATKGGNVNYASSAGNADTLNSYHANGLLTALSNSNNGVSITVGGTTKSISNISVNYANSTGNADKVDGQHFNWNNNKNDHTYLWAASDNGNAYLVHRASISVNYATYARYVYCTSGNYLNFQWSGQNGQPTWLWGSNDGANCYVWNPSNFSVYKANKSDQLEAYTSWGFTDPGRFVRAIRYNGWHTRLYMGYYRDATLENTVHVGYADDADTLDGNHASAFALVGHTHNYDNVYSKLGHTHDDRYYTESEINSKLSAYLPLAGGTMTGQIKGNNKGGSWIQGRANAALYQPRNVQGDWHPVVGFKTKTGSWEFGSVGSDDFATFSWGSDSNYNSGTNTTTVVYLRNIRGTIALTSEIPTVTNYYWANMKVSSTSSTSTSPTFSTCYTNNWFRSTGQTGWYNETYEGGWYMTDTTWVRTYNSKGIYTNTGTIYNLGHVWLACNNGYNVGIGTTSPSYKLHVSGDSYATGWSRAASGFYCQDTGVHFTHNGTKGQIAITSNNEFCWGANSNILYFNYAASSYGTTVTQYVWNAGSSSSYASHTMGHITLGNGNYQLKRVGSASSWYNGRDKAIVRQTSNAGDYCVIMSSKTANGSWEIGNDETDLCFTYITDSNYNNRNNNNPLQIWFTYEGIIHTSNYIYAAHFYENSDVRYKKILKNLSINSNTIANLPLFDFEWIENNSIGTGTSAQAVQQILPNLVSGTDKLTLDYGVLGTIAGITACKELVMQKSELQQLKEKVKQLEDKLRKYENI